MFNFPTVPSRPLIHRQVLSEISQHLAAEMPGFALELLAQAVKKTVISTEKKWRAEVCGKFLMQKSGIDILIDYDSDYLQRITKIYFKIFKLLKHQPANYSQPVQSCPN